MRLFQGKNLATGTEPALIALPGRADDRPAVQPVHLTRTAARPPAATGPRAWNPWFLSPAVFASAALATFLLLFLRTSSVTASTPQTNPLFDPRNANLQMRIETNGPGLLLSWNRYSRTVQASSSALLAIQDGEQRRDLTLDRNQILTGSVFYRPASDDVSFRLELRDAHGSNVSQILRVLNATPPRTAAEPALPVANPSARSREDQAEDVTAKPAVTVRPAVARHEDSLPVQVASAAPAAPAPSKPALPPPPSVDSSPAAAQTIPAQLRPAPATDSIAPSTPTPQPAVAPAPAPAKDSPAYVPPRAVKWVQPSMSIAQPLDVKVKVRIDEAGRVVAAHALMDGATRDKKLLAAAAAAVRQWTFEPAKAHGANVPCEEVIVIHLGPEAQ